MPHSPRMNPCQSAVSRIPVSTESRDLYIRRNSGINLIRLQGGLEFSTLCSPKLIKFNAELNRGAIDLPIEGIRFCLTQLALGIAQADGDHSLQLPQPQLMLIQKRRQRPLPASHSMLKGTSNTQSAHISSLSLRNLRLRVRE